LPRAKTRALGKEALLAKISLPRALGKERPSANLFFAKSQALDKGQLSAKASFAEGPALGK
jgi:hypothetical protein